MQDIAKKLQILGRACADIFKWVPIPIDPLKRSFILFNNDGVIILTTSKESLYWTSLETKFNLHNINNTLYSLGQRTPGAICFDTYIMV